MKLNRERGSTLFVVLFFIVLLSAFAGAAFNYTSGTAAAGQRSTQMTLGYAVADGAMETVYSRWRAIMQAHTTKNLNARVFITPTSIYNNLNRDITVVTLLDLGLPAGYLGLPASIADPAAATSDRAGTISIRTVDVFGRPYGTWGVYGANPVAGCTDPDTTLIEAVTRPVVGVYYPPYVTPDYTFKTAIASANGFEAVNLVYEVNVQISIPSRGGPVPVSVRRRFTRSIANAAQAAIFFENRLEVFPGSNMNVAGRVHTNDSLYEGTKIAAIDLEFVQRVTYVEQHNTGASATAAIVQTGYGFTDTQINDHVVDPTLRFQGNGTSYAPDKVDPMLVGGIDRDFLKAYDLTNNPNYNNNSLREIIERPVKKSTATGDPSGQSYNSYWDVTTTGAAGVAQTAIEGARLYNQASIKVNIMYDAAGHLDLTPGKTEIRARTADGMADGELMSTANPALNTAILNALNVDTGAGVGDRIRTTIKDTRETNRNTVGNPIAATTLDVGALRTAIIASGYDFNGVLYIADVTGQNLGTVSYNNSATDYEIFAGNRLKHAIMLTNAADLPGSQYADLTEPKRAFSVATENGVYVKGDFNTFATGSSVPTNVGGADTFQARYAGDAPVTAAIMADAVTVVSRNFDPVRGYDSLYDPKVSTIDPTKLKAINPVTGAEIDPNNIAALIAGNAVNELTRQAVSTTINAGVVSGIFGNTLTEVGGGATNLIRFLENWGQAPQASTTAGVYNYVSGLTASVPALQQSSTFTYKGSMMQSFYSRELTSHWSKPALYQAYSAPFRNVRFDESFITKPPAGFPGTIAYTKGAWQRF